MISKVTTLPPGSITIFAVEVDNYGNEVYVGGPIIVGGNGEDLSEDPQPATYNTPPTPKTTEPQVDPSPGGRNIDMAIVDSLRFTDGQPTSIEVRPDVITGWQNGEAVWETDGAHATIDAPGSGYCDALELSGFDMSQLPEGTEITGIKVTVLRSKI
jgi:hypothetical protein